MAIANFSIVIIGATLPADQFDVEELQFRRQALKPIMRANIALQAEAKGIALQIFPERFEVTVTEPRNLAEDASEVVSIANSIFDYTGPKSIKGVGHNMQFVADGTVDRKLDAVSGLLQADDIENTLEHPLVDADLTLYFKFKNESLSKVTLLTQASDRVVFDFNTHYESTQLAPRTSINHLGSSLRSQHDMAIRLEARLGEAVE